MQVERTRTYLEHLLDPTRAVAPLWGYESNSFVIRSMGKPVEAAGLRKGDLLAEVEGRPIRVIHDFSRALGPKRAGETLAIRVRRGNANELVPLSIPLTPANAPGWQDRVVQLVIEHTMPWICILLGYWVVMVRPRDLRACFLFLLMLGFSGIATALPGFSFVAGWPLPLSFAAIAARVLASESWPVWMLLFALVFPRPFPWLGRWWPLLALYLAPVISFAVWDALAAAFAHVGPAPIAAPPPWLGGVSFWMGALCIGGFFAGIGHRMIDTKEPDARRRLRILYVSASVSLTPSFLIMLVGAATSIRFTDLPVFVWLPSLLLVCLLPVSLAYIILVERALDVRVAIRQGIQYALAKGMLTVVRFALIVFVVVMSVRITDDPWGNLPQFILVVSLTVLAVIAIRAGSDRLRTWVDRRFFREAYNTELLLTTLAERVTDLRSEGEVVETVCDTISSSLHVPAVGAFLRPATPGHPQEAEFAYGTPAGVEWFRTKRIPMEAATEAGRGKSRSDSHGADLLVAIPGRHGDLGILALGPKRSEAAYSRADLQLLNTVARQAGMAIENSRLAETVAHQLAQRELLDREIQLAGSIQQRLLPIRLPIVEGFAFAGICEPAQSVGGDYFDFIPLPQGRIAFAVGDVSGKGIPAALLMASLQASLRGLLAGELFAGGSSPDLALLMAKLNTLIYEATPASRFVTLLLGILDPQTGDVSLANAGHCPALLGRQLNPNCGRELIQSSARGPALGLRREASYVTETLQMRPGDLLLAYTDGISEAMNPDREEFGDEGVRQFTASLNGTSAQAAIEELRREVHRFAAGAPQHDDLTAIAVATVRV